MGAVMVLAAWSASVALLIWLDRPSMAWWGALGAGMGLLQPGNRLFVLVAAALSMILKVRDSQGAASVPKSQIVEAGWRFWQETGILLTAGLTFWQAVETAAQAEPLLTAAVSQAAQGIAIGKPNDGALHEVMAEDGPVAALLLAHGYRHGITASQVLAHSQHLRRRLLYERELKKRRDPLWLTVLPAVLLVNVLWVFVAPMLALAGHGWLKL